MKKPHPIVGAIVVTAVAYATLRYNVFQGVPWSDWPVYVLNKAAAVSSLVMLLVWTLRAQRGRRNAPGGLLAAAARLALLHTALSIAILSPAYYPAFYNGARLTWQGSLSLLLGVSTASGLVMSARGPLDARATARRLGLVTFAVGLHAAIYGYPGWFTPSLWPGHLPPITMLSAVA